MTKRIFRSILAVSAAVFLAGLAFLSVILYNYFGDRIEAELHNEAVYLSAAVEKNGVEALGLINTKERLTLVDKDGNVIYDNKADPEQMDNHSERKEISDAMKRGVGSAKRHSDTLGEETLYYALKLENGDILRVSSTQRTITSLVLGLVQPVCIVFILMLVLSGAASMRAAKKIVGPINSIDPENPDESDAYEELSPLLAKISRQKSTISRQLDEAKRQQREFALITDNMQEGLLVIDEKTDILSYNRSALKLLGVKAAQTGKSVFLLSRKESFSNAVDTALSGKYADVLMEISDRICHVAVSPVAGAGSDSKPAGAVILITDETEKAKREEMRREFSANVSHELKTPLTSISGFAEILKDGMVKSCDVPKFAGNIFNEARRLISLIEDIIEISKLDEEKNDYKKEKIEVMSEINSISQRLCQKAAEKKVGFSVEGKETEFYTVRSVFDEIIYNLCDNAVKYNKDGGSVKVSVETDDGELIIKVKDTGIGIPENQTGHIFERFYRVDKSHSKSIGGTGLGLSIVKHGVSFLKGSVEVESVLSKGSTFKITLPTDDGENARNI